MTINDKCPQKSSKTNVGRNKRCPLRGWQDISYLLLTYLKAANYFQKLTICTVSGLMYSITKI